MEFNNLGLVVVLILVAAGVLYYTTQKAENFNPFVNVRNIEKTGPEVDDGARYIVTDRRGEEVPPLYDRKDDASTADRGGMTMNQNPSVEGYLYEQIRMDNWY